MNKTTAIKNFRNIAFLEGLSYLLLMAIAMPLKYGANILWPVKYIGWAHGILFVAYCILMLLVYNLYKWNFIKLFWVFISSLLPFGTFVIDAKILKNENV